MQDTTTGTETPIGRRYRRGELDEARASRDQWRWTCWGLIAGLLLLASIWGVREITRVPIKVLMLQIDEAGTSRVLGPLPDRYIPTEQVMKRELRTFVEVLRRVITDKVLMGEEWDKTKGIFGRVTDKGRKLLEDYIATTGDPLKKQEPVMVEVLRVLPRGKQTMDISWIERHFSAEMELIATTAWSGIFSYTVLQPRTEAEFYVNPTGIWWDQWSFSKDR